MQHKNNGDSAITDDEDVYWLSNNDHIIVTLSCDVRPSISLQEIEQETKSFTEHQSNVLSPGSTFVIGSKGVIVRRIGIAHDTTTAGEEQWNSFISFSHPSVLSLLDHWTCDGAHVLVYPNIEADRTLENEILKMDVTDRIQV